MKCIKEVDILLYSATFNSAIHWTAGLLEIHPVNPGSVVMRGAATARFLCIESNGKLYSSVRNVHIKMVFSCSAFCDVERLREYYHVPLLWERLKTSHQKEIGYIGLFSAINSQTLKWCTAIGDGCNFIVLWQKVKKRLYKKYSSWNGSLFCQTLSWELTKKTLQWN